MAQPSGGHGRRSPGFVRLLGSVVRRGHPTESFGHSGAVVRRRRQCADDRGDGSGGAVPGRPGSGGRRRGLRPADTFDSTPTTTPAPSPTVSPTAAPSPTEAPTAAPAPGGAVSGPPGPGTTTVEVVPAAPGLQTPEASAEHPGDAAITPSSSASPAVPASQLPALPADASSGRPAQGMAAGQQTPPASTMAPGGIPAGVRRDHAPGVIGRRNAAAAPWNLLGGISSAELLGLHFLGCA